MMGLEGWAVQSKGRPCRCWRQELRTLRTRSTRRPREDLVLPRQNLLNLSAAEGVRRPQLGRLVAPAKVGAVDPHPVQDNGQAARDRNDGAPHAAALRHTDAPGLQPGPSPTMNQQRLGSFIEHGSQHEVAALGDAAVIVDLA